MIGTLTLMITALALTGMDSGQDDEAIRRAENHVVLLKKIAASRKKISELRKSLGMETGLQDKIKALRAKIAKLESLRKTAQESKTLDEQAKKAKAKVSALDSELAKLRNELEKLKEELVRTRTVMSEETIKVLPPGSGRPIKYSPTFVEAGKSGLVVYDGKEPYDVPAAEISKHKKLADLLKRLAAKPSSQVVLLIRSDGVGTRNAMVSLANANGVKTGQLPLVGGGTVDLSKF